MKATPPPVIRTTQPQSKRLVDAPPVAPAFTAWPEYSLEWEPSEVVVQLSYPIFREWFVRLGVSRDP